MEISILVVDDEYDKISLIFEAAKKHSVEPHQIEHVTTTAAARRAIQRKHYDLVVIDLKLPALIGDPPSEENGLNLLHTISIDANAKSPTYIIGLTGKEDNFEATKKEFELHCWLLLKYSTQDMAWQSSITKKIEHITKLKPQIEDSTPTADIVILTALRQPEFDAVLNLPCQWENFEIPNDPTVYSYGMIKSSDSSWRVVAASAPRKGMSSSSALATKMALTFRPKFIVMVGICAGVPGKTKFGDIIVADPTWDWGSGKHKVEEDGSGIFESAPYHMPLNPAVRAKFLEIKASEAATRQIMSSWSGDVPHGRLSLHIGPMASGASVLANKEKVRDISLQQREVIGIEMEAFAVMSATETVPAPQPTAIIIKSVCDHADSAKADDWQAYASYTSAQCFYHYFASQRNPDYLT